jgi:glycerophosphoryl diester phosphodiesterase
MLPRLALLSIAVASAGVGWAACRHAPAADEPPTARLPPRPWVIAHRGAAAYAPENTVAAFRLGADQGATFVELDLQRTRDGHLVALHDLTLERTTDVAAVFPNRSRPDPNDDDAVPRWWLDDFTLDDLRSLDAGAWFDEQFAGTRIPTFDETLEAVRGRTGLFIELKSPERYPGIEQEMMAVLARHGLDRPGADPATPIMVQSFTVPSLERLSAMGTSLPLHALIAAADANEWLSDDGLARIGGFATGISPEKSTLTSHGAGWARARQLGLPITPWTFRASAVRGFPTVTDEMAHAIAGGADGVITDNPDLAPRRAPLEP